MKCVWVGGALTSWRAAVPNEHKKIEGKFAAFWLANTSLSRVIKRTAARNIAFDQQFSEKMQEKFQAFQLTFHPFLLSAPHSLPFEKIFCWVGTIRWSPPFSFLCNTQFYNREFIWVSHRYYNKTIAPEVNLFKGRKKVVKKCQQLQIFKWQPEMTNKKGEKNFYGQFTP